MLINSGKSGTAGIEVSFSSTVDEFVLLFAHDLAAVCTAFGSYLKIEKAYNRLVPRPGSGQFAMCRFVALSGNAQARKTAYTFEIILGRASSKTAETATPGSFSIEYTLERLLRLLQANGNFNRHAGISELISLEGGITVPEAYGIQGANLQVASLLVTYTRDEPQLYLSNK